MLLFVASVLLAGLPLSAGKTYTLPKPGRFDALTFDSVNHRVLAAHSEAGTLAVLDTVTGKSREITTGPINGVAVSERLNRVFVAGGGNKLIALDRKTLAPVGSVDLGGPADIVTLDTKRNQVYVCHDDGIEDWVFDGKSLKLLGSVAIEEAPEFVEYDAATDKLYQNIKSTNHVQVIDPKTKKVVATWPTAPMESPHGIALDLKNRRVYSVGRNGKLACFDLKTGKLLSTTEITSGVDQIAIDHELGRIYCPGQGKLSVVAVYGSTPMVLQTLSIPRGVHTLTVDPKTHDVWLAYADAKNAYLAQYIAR